ncbi:MAG TPA: tetratricopeptide repeat protein [Candidatus Acidoferrum sp.]|nr:tetratricopeptide repeat protein [Candidatus Acidoferrum sp.]
MLSRIFNPGRDAAPRRPSSGSCGRLGEASLPCNRLWRAAALALLALWLPVSSHAEISAAAFDSANKLYEEGKFSDAATAYAKLIQGGQVSAPLYFNLGNAFFKSGQMGRAIAAYRLAAQLTPRDPDVRANLQFARNQVQGPSLSATRWQRWLGRLTLNEWTVLAACALWVFFLLLGLLQWRPGLRPALKGYIIAAGCLALCLCGLTGTAFYQARVSRVAIVINGEATVRNGPLAESKAAFTAHDGAELQVVDTKDEWLEVSAGPRETGWLRRDQVLTP